MEKKTKRYYQKDEIVWIIELKKDGKVKSINKKDLEMTVIHRDDEGLKEYVGKMWDFDKLKYARKEEILSKNKNEIPMVYFSKVKEDAIIPSKRSEDAGYDIYANIDGGEVREIHCPAFKTTLVPTGIAMALPKTHYFNIKHERGSTGKIGMSVLSGVIDSGFRGEIFVAIMPLYKDILITSEVSEVENLKDIILYPYSKAICQGTIEQVPKVEIKEIPFKELSKIESERRDTMLGQSGK